MEAEGRTIEGGAESPLLADVHADPGLRRRLIAVLGASAALGDHLVAHPEHYQALRTAPDGLAPTAEGRLEPADGGNGWRRCGPRTAWRCCGSRRPT
ncbi:[Glutamate--ammonia-ligase] adenylyltransferase [Micromonospora saelicesensis]|nr:[Glutamate--ammonia-ligase] adenylyltransferase [Micromonospora saelicesensis]